MASFDSMIFLSLLIAISAFMAAPSTVEAGLFVDEYVNVTGTVPCAVNTTIFPNGTLNGKPFPNATVQLQCGKNDTVVASNTTNGNGTFSIIYRDPPRAAAVVYLRTFINCTAVVTTPLSTCNSTLPANGTLKSPLKPGGPQWVNIKTKYFLLLADKFEFVNKTTPSILPIYN